MKVEKKAGDWPFADSAKARAGAPLVASRDRETGKMPARRRFLSLPFPSAWPRGCDRALDRPSGREREGIGGAKEPDVRARTMRGY